MNASVHSIYMDNISKEVINSQARCVNAFLPEGWEFWQHISFTKSHPEAIEIALRDSKTDVNIFLDIDCVPLSKRSFTFLAECVIQDEKRGLNQGLAGCVQRANHIPNGNHMYVGPFCMAFSKSHYKDLGSPSFMETDRGDCGEELTYRWSEKSGFLCPPVGPFHQRYSSNIHFLWPFSVEHPLWELDFGWKFGLGTTYGAAPVGAELFYHAFNARDPKTATMFINQCNKTLGKLEA